MLDFFLELILRALSGWAYVFSAEVRRRTHKRWERQSDLESSIEVIGGILGVLASLFIAGFIIHALVS